MRDFVFLKNNAKYTRIFFKDLQYIEARDKYVRFITVEKPFLVLGSLSYVEKKLPEDQFCRIHKSYIVSIRHITEFNYEAIFVNGQELPLGKQYKSSFYDKVQILFADGNSPVKLSSNTINDFTIKL